MAQYLISVLYDDARRPRHPGGGRRDRRLQRAVAGGRPLGLRRRARRAEHGDHRRRPGRRAGVHRRALPGDQGVPRRLLDHRGPRSRRGAGARRRRDPRRATGKVEVRPFLAASDASVTRRGGHRPCPPRGVGPGGRGARPAVRRPRRRRGGGRRGLRRRPSSAGRSTASRRIPVAGSPPPPTARPSTGCVASPGATRSTRRR